MAKKNIRTLGRKALSLLLTLTMVTGMLNIPAMAAGFDDQTMDGYYIISAEGNQGLAEKGVESVTEDGFTLTKTIEQTGKDAFDITLSVETSQTVTTNAAAIQLVIDNSSSMEQCADCGSDNCRVRGHDQTRLEAIQDILTRENGFLDSLASANTGKVLVSVVKFDKNAHKVSNWLDIKNAANLQAVKDDINAIVNGNGTNIHGGLMLGRNRLNMSEVSNVASKYLVLLSDGAPYAHANESNSTDRINGVTSGNHATPAQNIAATIRSSGTTLYTVGYGTTSNENALLLNIAGDASRAFSGHDSASVNAAFANIAQSATEGMSGAGTSVTDPMGQYIVLGDVSALSAEGVSADGNGILWDLDPARAEVETHGDTTTYTYSVTYPITLDTSVEGFEEDVYHPANGHTWLGVPQADGSVKKIAFLVPGVCGVIPEYDWTVEYYLQDEASINEEAPTYTLDDTDEMGIAKLHSSVSAPEGFESKYEKDNYTFAKGDTVLKITADPEQNVIRLYYDLITAPVTVKHYYKTTTITPAGEEIVGDYIEDPDKTVTELAVVESEYEAVEQPVFGGVSFAFDYAKPADKAVIIDRDGENLIELFYSRTDDQRVITTAQVDHVYTLYTYELNADGEYELTAHAPVVEEKVQYSEDLRATTVYNVSDAPKAGYEDYDLNEDEGDYADLLRTDGTLHFVLAEDSAANVRTLHFEKVVDERVKTSVTVEHIYTKNITAIEDGAVVNYNDPDGEVGLTETFDLYVGERFEAVEEKEYEGDLYHSDESNASKLVIASVEGGEVIQLYYDLSVAPEQASVIANHYWRTYTDVTVELTEEVVNEETGETETRVIGTDVETREVIDHAVEGIEYTSLYVGQKHTEAQQSWGEGYTFNPDESTVEVIAGEGREADLYYDRYAEDDERRDADITVHHIYTTHLTTVVDGEVRTLTIVEGPEVEAFTELKAGDEFAATAQPVYNENEYTQTTAEEDLSVILQPGTNAAIVIEYEREAEELTEAVYSANYEYRTYVMTVNENGVAGYHDAPEVTTDAASGEGYVGERIVLDAKAMEGFAPLATNPGTVQILTEGENHWDFIYERYIPLAPGSVTVNHHYKTTTVAVNGTASENTQSVYGIPTTKYVGESYTAEAAPNGFEQTGLSIDAVAAEPAESVTVTVGENTVIDFFYEKTEDFSIPVTYSVAHEYYLYDWDGSLLNESKPEPVTGTGFATNPLVVAPETTDYELTSATYNGEEMASYTVILQEGENKVLFVYEKVLPRDFVDVTVIHNYYKDEAALLAEVPAPETQYTEVTANVPESSEFSAQTRDLEGYEFHSASPESMTVTVTDEGENLIVINYVRRAAEYEVVHVYYGNGEYEGKTAESFTGLHGDVVLADSIAREPAYNGNEYSFVSVSGDIVLNADEKQTIELVYERTYIVLVPADYSVSHEYRTYQMTVNAEGVAGYHTAPEIITDGYSRDGFVGEVVELDERPMEGYTPVAGNPGTVQTLLDGENHWRFVYERYLPLSAGSVVVNHHYTTVTTNADGSVSENTESKLGEVVAKALGERYTGTAVPNGFEQVGAKVDGASVANEASVTVTVGENTVIDFYYEKAVDNSVPVTYSIVHEYYLYDWDGTLVSVSKSEPVTGSGFVTNSVTAEAQPNGYDLQEVAFNGGELKAPYTVSLTAGRNEIVFVYRLVQERDSETVTVIHEYYESADFTGQPEKVTEEQFPNIPEGSVFTAEPKEEKPYEFHSTDPSLTIEVVEGEDNTVIIRYIREKAAYAVSHEYRTYEMTVENGKAGYHTEPAVTTDGYNGTGFVGQTVELDARAIEGFKAVSGNPATEQVLTDGENRWSFVYERYIPLAKASVVVNHHYTTILTAENGAVSEETVTVSGRRITKYIGEAYTASAVPGGFVQTGLAVDGASVANEASVTVTVGENTVVDFYYEKSVDKSVPVTYSIVHEYYLYDWDGALVSVSKSEPVTGSGFVTNSVTAEAQPNGYDLQEVTFNGTAIEAPYTVSLTAGRNEFVFVYRLAQERDSETVTVVHEYYESDDFTGQPTKVTKETFSDVPENSEFTAEIKETEGYEFHSTDPSLTIEVVEGEDNTVIIRYIREKAKYEVVHIYFRNTVEVGRTSETFEGLDGETVLAESMERIERFEEKNYNFFEISGDIVLDADEVQTIVLKYARGEGGKKPDPKPEEPTPDAPIDIPEEPVPLTPAPSDGDVLIPDEEVPLANVPKTGDESFRFTLMALASALGLAALHLKRKREEEEI